MDDQPRQRGFFGPDINVTGLFDKAGNIGGALAMILFALFWLGISGTMFGVLLWQLAGQAWMAATYQPVEATVTQYTPRGESDDGETPAKIAYWYEVDGWPREGAFIVRINQPQCDEYTPALSALLTSGNRLAAWYDPRHPEQSTLVPVVQPAMIAMLIFVMPFGMVGLSIGSSGVMQIMSAVRGGRGVLTSGAAPKFPVFITAYFVLSVVGTIGLILLATQVNWRVVAGLGLAEWLIGVPAATILAVRWLARRSHRKAAVADAGVPASTLAVQPAVTLPLGRNRGSAADGRKMLPFFALFWCAITGLFVGFVVVTVWRHIDAKRRFESTPGVVLSGSVESHSDGDGTTYSPAIRYRYTVAGQDYVSPRYSFNEVSSSDGRYAHRVVAENPPGKRVVVYYDPEKPSEAILALDVPPMMWFLSLFLQPFILVGVGLVAAIAVGVIRRRRIRAFLAAPLQPPCYIPTWGWLEMARDGYSVRPAPPFASLLLAFAGGYGLTCFLSIFVLAFLVGGFEGDPAGVKVAFVAAVCVGVVSVAWTVTRGRSDGVLELNDSAGRLTVARRKGAVDMAVADVDHLTVRSVPSKWRNKKDPTDMVPQLTSITTDGRDVAVRRFPGDDEESFALARALGEWIAGVTRKPFK